jgi:thiol:disulfide interchange protein
MQESTSLLGFLLTAFLAGFASIFMPCIYPIMPMTVSFFTKQSQGTRKATFYGLSIMFVFGLIGLVATVFGAPFLNFISTHWIPNLIFFVIFIIFGVSLLGAFEIVLPHEVVNNIDRMSEKGGFVGIFFMALTLVVVSFSCTAPFVGSLLIMAAKGEVWRPLWGMLAFGLPFGVVFTSLAMFPQWLKSLPKSGGWMNEMKAVFGILEFALALKFLSNIDLTYHFNYISRNTFLIIWIIIFVTIGLYILGILRLPKDSKVKKYNVQRFVFGTLFLGFAAYMVPGVSHNKELNLLSGLLPPKTIASTVADDSKLRDLPHELKGFYDYDDALAYSKEIGKPLFIDFTGYACANCRKMEENVWPKPEVLEKLKNNFVIASLYVDDKKELPKEKQYTSKYDDELKVTVGDKNMDLEITKYNNNAQPYYIIEDSNGKSIVKQPIGYTSKEEFMKFLDEGIGNYKKP